jgi:hypothetical protein
MGKFISAIFAVKSNVAGICRNVDVVAGVAIEMATQALCASWQQARCLAARLLGLKSTGHLALQACHVHVAGATHTAHLTGARTMSRWYPRPSWPGSATGSDRPRA